MEEQPTPLTVDRQEWKPIFILLLLASLLRLWQLTHTEVIARDSIHYIRFAWRLEREPTAKVLRTSFQHPAYPAAVWAMSYPVRFLMPGDLAEVMQISAQLVSAFCSILLIVPLYFLGRELFAQRVCFWAILLFQCLPATGRLMADGLTEPMVLLFVSTGLLGAARGLRTGSVAWFAVAGFAGALAYLTRPEGSLPIGVAGLLLTILWLLGKAQGGFKRYLLNGTALCVSALILALPYMLTIGGYSIKPTANQLLDAAKEAVAAPTVEAGLLPFAVWIPGWKPRITGTWPWAIQTFGLVLMRGFFYVFWIPALLGLIYTWPQKRNQPSAWLLWLTMAILAGFLLRVAARFGYLSDRHTVLILMLGLFWAVEAILWAIDAAKQRWPSVSQAAPALLALFCVIPLVKTLEPLHGDRTGFREAGHWLASHAQPDEKILDPFCWADYYAGRAFRPETTVSEKAPVRYVVVEEGISGHSHMPEVEQAKEVARRGMWCNHGKCAVVRSWFTRWGIETLRERNGAFRSSKGHLLRNERRQ